MSPETAWKATLGELELQMTKATFNTWLKDARLLKQEGTSYYIGVRNAYAKDWLENRLQDTILRTLTAITDEEATLVFEVNTDEPKQPQKGGAHSSNNKNGATATTTATTESKKSGLNATRKFTGSLVDESGLRKNYIFSTFIVGTSNRLAHAAALSVAEMPGQTYNPLFIYGGVGLGKTHLLHAIAHRCRDQGLHVCYITSETFTNDLVQSIRSQQMAEFRERYRTPDVLLIDDIQFVAGKESTQEELFHTFNDLHSLGKQVIISSDRPPKAMATLQERLQSRFEWGLMADVQMPDVETRLAILTTKAENRGMYLPNNVLDMIAHQVRHNIRELEGALNKVIAYAQLTGSPIDVQLARMALSDLFSKPDKVTVDSIIEGVCKYYRINKEALLGSGRSRAVAFPRQMAMYLARTETDASFPQIGSHIGKRDHTTIIHGYEKIAELVETDASVRQDMLAIKASLYDQP